MRDVFTNCSHTWNDGTFQTFIKLSPRWYLASSQPTLWHSWKVSTFSRWDTMQQWRLLNLASTFPSPIYHVPPGLCDIRIQGRGQERVKTRLRLLLPASCATGWPLHAEWPRSHLQRAPIVTSIYSYLEKKSTNAFSFFKRDANAFTLMNLERRHRNTQSFYLHDIGICVFISSLT